MSIDPGLTFHKIAREASTVGTTPTLILKGGQGRNYLTIDNDHGSATLYAGWETDAAVGVRLDIASSGTLTLHGYQGPLYLSGSTTGVNYEIRYGWSRGDDPAA